jgi:TPR repeat protein
MSALDREKRYIRKWRPKAVRGDGMAMSNIAAAYRILENFRLAARWYRRASERRDGDALTEWGYCLQHGVGTRKDARAAERAYRAAIRSKWMTDYCREEAMYHLAVLLLGRRTASSRRAAVRLLRLASADGDYPQAEVLLQMVLSADLRGVCVCRRHLRPRLAQRHCPVHGPRRGQPDGPANRSQPAGSGTNRAPLAAGSGG